MLNLSLGNQQKGFTLIELLIVIAIIGVLAGAISVSSKIVDEVRKKTRIVGALQFSQNIQQSLAVEAVGIWKFDEGSGSTAYDTSGYGNDGTIFGATWTDDTLYKVIGQGSGKYALSFDGVNDYVDVGNNSSLRLTTELTYEAWFKRNNGGDSVQAIVSHYWRPVLWFYSNRFAFTDDEGGGGYWFANGTTNPTVGTWYHVAGTFSLSEGKMKIYVNGVLEGSVDKNTAINLQAGEPVIIGANYRNPAGDRANGIIDEVGIYRRALTTLEIQRHYAEGLERHNNLAQKN